MESKVKHLEMIQAVINRLASNSFLLRGWSITLVTALVAIIGYGSNSTQYLIVYVPIIVFWLLDGYFLSRERRYRALYDHIRKLPNKRIDFTMDARSFKKGKNTWISACLSTVSLLFYGSLLGVVIFVSYLSTR